MFVRAVFVLSTYVFIFAFCKRLDTTQRINTIMTAKARFENNEPQQQKSVIAHFGFFILK